VSDVCRGLGISEATFDVWKEKYANMGVSERLRQRLLEDENARLKKLVAGLTLDKHILNEVIAKKSKAVTPSAIDAVDPHGPTAGCFSPSPTLAKTPETPVDKIYMAMASLCFLPPC
jgi:putative transposase